MSVYSSRAGRSERAPNIALTLAANKGICRCPRLASAKQRKSASDASLAGNTVPGETPRQ